MELVCLLKACKSKHPDWSFVILKCLPFFLRFWKSLCVESSQWLHFTPWNLSGLFNFVPWLCVRTFDPSSVHNIVFMYFCGSFLLGTNYFFLLEMRWFVMGSLFAETPVNPLTVCTPNTCVHTDTNGHTYFFTFKKCSQVHKHKNWHSFTDILLDTQRNVLWGPPTVPQLEK